MYLSPLAKIQLGFVLQIFWSLLICLKHSIKSTNAIGKLSLWKGVWWIKPQIFLTDPLQKKKIFATFPYISFTPERLQVCFFSGLSYCCPHFRNNFVLNWVCPLNGCGPLGGRWVPRWRWKGGSGVGGGGHGTPCHLPPLPSKTHLAISHIVNYHPSLQKPTFIFTSLPPWHCQLQTPSLTSNTPAPSLPGVTHLYPGHNINNTYNHSGTLWASWISKKSVFVKRSTVYMYAHWAKLNTSKPSNCTIGVTYLTAHSVFCISE